MKQEGQMEIFTRFAEAYDRLRVDAMSLQDYLLGCREDPLMRATAAERMCAAIGEPEMIDTSQDQRLGRIFLNRTIKRYGAFKELYGAEETIERIVGFFRHASQGLEERKQTSTCSGQSAAASRRWPRSSSS